MPILQGFPPSNTISPRTRHSTTYVPVEERWHAPTDDESWHLPIRPKKKHPKFTVEIIEEEKWLS